MAKISDRVMEMVRREIGKNPDVTSGTLYDQARKLDRSISSLDLRQFHARYPLQVRRSMKGGKRKAAAKRAGRPPATVAAAPIIRRRGRPPKNAALAAVSAAAVPASKAAAAPRAGTATDRNALRNVLLEFAGVVARAENKVDVITVIGGLEGWVDRIMKAAS